MDKMFLICSIGCSSHININAVLGVCALQSSSFLLRMCIYSLLEKKSSMESFQDMHPLLTLQSDLNKCPGVRASSGVLRSFSTRGGGRE